MIEKATHVTIFWNLARNPEKISSKIRRKNAKFELFAIELMNIHSFNRKIFLAIFDEKIEIRERCKGVHFVDLGESFPTLNLLFEPDSHSNSYLLAKFGFDTAEYEPFRVRWLDS